MPYTTVVAGTTITAAWGNANVRDQVVTPFASASARTSAITSPVEGMLSYRSDSKVFEGYDGTGWRPASSPVLAGFRVTNAGNPIATTSGTTEMDLAKLQMTGLSLITGRYYLARYKIVFTKTVAGDTFNLILRANTAVSGTQIGLGGFDFTDGLTGGIREVSILFLGDSSYTSIFLSVQRSGGTGTLGYFGTTGGFNRGWAMLHDLGPNQLWTDVA